MRAAVRTEMTVAADRPTLTTRSAETTVDTASAWRLRSVSFECRLSGSQRSRSRLRAIFAVQYSVFVRARSVVWTRVPEASVDEDSYTSAVEHDINSTPDLWLGFGVLPERQSTTVEGGSERDFRTRVALPVATHDCAHGVRRSRWCNGQHAAMIRALHSTMSTSG